MNQSRLYVPLFYVLMLTGLGVPHVLPAQPSLSPKKMTPSEIYEGLQKLQVLASVMYVAAHPDDENTRLIAYLANETKAKVTYLSLTRGDGGQNLIGTELWEELGLLRTQELLGARRIDGGHQWFSRAYDFGYSKTPKETLTIWNKDQVLEDVVWAFRKFQPDIVINRFPAADSFNTHGHHTSSAILSQEAFGLAGNPKAYPNQLKVVQAWNPSRLFFNTSWFFYGGREKFDAMDKRGLCRVNVGVYYPLKGQSNTEVAALSRSQHRCQGFGSTGSRGEDMEYLELLKGTMPGNIMDLLEGINTSWSRVPGGDAIGNILKKASSEFRTDNPSLVVNDLLRAYQMMEALPKNIYWRQVKMDECKELIRACLGLYLEGVASEPSATPGDVATVNIEAIKRAQDKVEMVSVHVFPNEQDTTFLGLYLEDNQPVKFKVNVPLGSMISTSNPYWLNEPRTRGMFVVEELGQRGMPQNVRPIRVHWMIRVNGIPLDYWTDVHYRMNDPAKGEIYKPFEIVPPVSVATAAPVYIFQDGKPQKVNIKVLGLKNSTSGILELKLPEGWKSTPASQPFEIKSKNEELLLDFLITPPAGPSEGTLGIVAKVGGQNYNRHIRTITYDHIPAQTFGMPAEAKLVRMDLKIKGNAIGYIMGAGDEVPDALRQAGYQLTILEPEQIKTDQLSKFDAVVVGIRAYNTLDYLSTRQKYLLEYVSNGGTLVVQYQTNNGFRIPKDQLAPIELNLSRERVTDEDAKVQFLQPNHPALVFPNKISEKDFKGWVQERGLYFADKWHPSFVPLLSCNDPGEKAREGGLLVAPYGKGWYVYTGYAFFRQLPAGVPGAYRLFANLLALGKK